MAVITDEELIDYVVGDVSHDRALQIERLTLDDEELAAQLLVMRLLAGESRPTSFESGGSEVIEESVVRRKIAELAVAWGADRLVDAPGQCRILVNEVFVELVTGQAFGRVDRLVFYRTAADEIERFVGECVTQFQDRVGTALLQGDTTVTMTKENELRARQEGLRQLRAINALQADVYVLHQLAGRDFLEVADMLGTIEVRQVEREYEMASAEISVRARAWAKSQGMIVALGA